MLVHTINYLHVKFENKIISFHYSKFDFSKSSFSFTEHYLIANDMGKGIHRGKISSNDKTSTMKWLS